VVSLGRDRFVYVLALTECDLISGREAFALFLAAAEQGHAGRCFTLPRFPEFVTEQFKSLSTAEAWAWLLRAAEAGSVQAQYDAGAILATGGDWGNGAVVPVDLKAAVAWYRRAAEAGHAEAQFNLASMLSEGEGCERDVVAAKEWLSGTSETLTAA
jgi:TPR repeat protein